MGRREGADHRRRRLEQAPPARVSQRLGIPEGISVSGAQGAVSGGGPLCLGNALFANHSARRDAGSHFDRPRPCRSCSRAPEGAEKHVLLSDPNRVLMDAAISLRLTRRATSAVIGSLRSGAKNRFCGLRLHEYGRRTYFAITRGSIPFPNSNFAPTAATTQVARVSSKSARSRYNVSTPVQCAPMRLSTP